MLLRTGWLIASRAPGETSRGSPASGLLAGKRLELLEGTVPKLSRVAVLWNQNIGSGRNGKKADSRHET